MNFKVTQFTVKATHITFGWEGEGRYGSFR